MFWNISLQVKLFADALDSGSFDKHSSPLIIQAGSFETHPLHHFLILTILIILLVLLIPRVSEEASNCTSMFIDYRQCRTRSEIYWDKKREGRVFIPSRSQNSPKPHRRVIFLRAGFHFQISSVFPPPPPPPHLFLLLASDCGIISEWLDVIHCKLSLIITNHKYTFLVGPGR